MIYGTITMETTYRNTWYYIHPSIAHSNLSSFNRLKPTHKSKSVPFIYNHQQISWWNLFNNLYIIITSHSNLLLRQKPTT